MGPFSPQGRARPDATRRRIASFRKHFGEAHLYLAQHAAFPLAVTPELLYHLWANFQRDIQGEILNVPWIAVADLLLSGLYDEVSHELFEMDITLRELLLSDLKGQANFGQQRILELSHFLLRYIEPHAESHDPHVRDVAMTNRWMALAYTHPGKAARELAQALQASVEQNDTSEQIRLASLTETFAEPLAGFVPLLTYARGIGYFAQGDVTQALAQFKMIESDSDKVMPAAFYERTFATNGVPLGEENRIDQMLKQAGWTIQTKDTINVEEGQGIAIRDFPFSTGPFAGPNLFPSENLFPGREFLGYLLVVDGEAIGVVEVKEDTLLSVRDQLTSSQKVLPAIQLPAPIRSPDASLPFFYTTTGSDTLFTDDLEPETSSRRVFSFHRPETFVKWLRQARGDRPDALHDLLRSRLRRMPQVSLSEGDGETQTQAITEIEKALAASHPRVLVQIPNGRGKTKTLIQTAYRLLAFANAQRILYLVDRNRVDQATYRRFQRFTLPGSERKFTEQFDIQLLQNGAVNPDSRICISTVEHFSSAFSGVHIADEAHRSGQSEINESLTLQYNPFIPIEFFDVILIDDCTPDTYRQWQPLLEYFDALIVGAVSSADEEILNFFSGNLVYNYQEQNRLGSVRLKVFISYTHADQELRKKLEDCLRSLVDTREIVIWQDEEILPGTDWEDVINTRLNEADLILLLVSASFIASKYCWNKEVQAALQRHKAGTAHVIPIILRPALWQDTPLGQLQALPAGAKPITQWNDQEAAFEDVAQGIRKIIQNTQNALRELHQEAQRQEQNTLGSVRLKVFISYTHADQELRKKLEEHLSPLKHSGKITIWQDQEILPGTNWEDHINVHLQEADLILLLLSSDFLDSKYCWEEEVKVALERHKDGTAHVIPILLKPSLWQETPLGQLQALPTGAKPIAEWKDQEAAFEDVVLGIRKVVQNLRSLLPEREVKNPLPAILIGGVPHAGKSVLTYNLTRRLRQLEIPHYVFRASPDGEGDWFFEGDPEYVRQIRVKGTWTDTFRRLVCQALPKRLLPLIVDINGLPDEKDHCIFRACTHSILVLRDEKEEAVQIWRAFTMSNGLIPLVELRSQLSGHSELTAREPVLMGIITGLERRGYVYGPVFDALVERICELFNSYSLDELERLHLDNAPTEYVVHLDHQLGALAPGVDGWTPDLLEPLLAGLPTQTALSVYGHGPNWLYGTLALHARTQPFYLFDPCLGWVQPPLLRSGTLKPAAGSPLFMEPPKLMENAYILTIRPIHTYLDYTEADQLVFPELSPDHGVIVSGPLLPLWLFTALARFYAEKDVPWIALHDVARKRAFVIYSQVETHTSGDGLSM